jgi:hypothetical protein
VLVLVLVLALVLVLCCCEARGSGSQCIRAHNAGLLLLLLLLLHCCLPSWRAACAVPYHPSTYALSASCGPWTLMNIGMAQNEMSEAERTAAAQSNSRKVLKLECNPEIKLVE